MMMEIDPERAEFRAASRRLATDIAPLAATLEQMEGFPADLVAALAAAGFLGMRVPEEWGGAGMALGHYCIAQEELARVNPVLTVLMSSTNGLTPSAVLRHGTEAQRRAYLPLLPQGRLRTAFALTEPESGSDAASMVTKAVRTTEGWTLNGIKHFISGGEVADLLLVLAVTDPAQRARGGITAFLVDRGTPGLKVARVDHTIGSAAWSLAELHFQDCRLPPAAVLGTVGEGFRLAMVSLDEGRLSVASTCLGSADRLLDLAVQHASERRTFGAPLASRQAIQWMLADSAVEIATTRALIYETVRQAEAGQPVGAAASMCKLAATEMANRVADRVLQIHGGVGLIEGSEVGRLFRDLRIFRIGEGASEIQRMVIARSLLGRGDLGMTRLRTSIATSTPTGITVRGP